MRIKVARVLALIVILLAVLLTSRTWLWPAGPLGHVPVPGGSYVYGEITATPAYHFNAKAISRLFAPGPLTFLSPLAYFLASALLGAVVALGLAKLFSRDRLSLSTKLIVASVLPFSVFSLATAAYSHEPALSAVVIILWTLSIAMVAYAASIVRSNTWAFSLNAMFLVVSVASLVMATLFTDFWPNDDGWRGLFNHKNSLGFFATTAALLAIFTARRDNLYFNLSCAAIAVILVVAAKSTTALSTLILTLSYYGIYLAAGKKLKPATSALIFLVMLFVLPLILIAAANYVSPVFGKDETLSGRWDIWKSYFEYISLNPWFGSGAGTLSTGQYALLIRSELASTVGTVSPHSLYITLYGETGAFGLFLYLAPLLVIAALLPAALPGRRAAAAGALAVAILIEGAPEMLGTLNLSSNYLLLVLLVVSALRPWDSAANNRAAKGRSKRRRSSRRSATAHPSSDEVVEDRSAQGLSPTAKAP